ncbi:hypothetical protein V8F20_011847 [Naviculisporaceae sp. PSN 640]
MWLSFIVKSKEKPGKKGTETSSTQSESGESASSATATETSNSDTSKMVAPVAAAGPLWSKVAAFRDLTGVPSTQMTALEMQYKENAASQGEAAHRILHPWYAKAERAGCNAQGLNTSRISPGADLSAKLLAKATAGRRHNKRLDTNNPKVAKYITDRAKNAEMIKPTGQKRGRAHVPTKGASKATNMKVPQGSGIPAIARLPAKLVAPKPLEADYKPTPAGQPGAKAWASIAAAGIRSGTSGPILIELKTKEKPGTKAQENNKSGTAESAKGDNTENNNTTPKASQSGNTNQVGQQAANKPLWSKVALFKKPAPGASTEALNGAELQYWVNQSLNKASDSLYWW